MSNLYPKTLKTGILSALFTIVLLGWSELSAQVIYVDSAAVSNGNIKDGLSWATAFYDLQDALAIASSGQDIRMAKGTYYPTIGSSRTVSFELVDGVAIYGGYSANAAQPDERDIDLYPTILSGDLNEDDTPNFGNRADNSHSVVYAELVSASTRLDGLTIKGGNADDNNGPFEDRNSSGGGLFNLGQTGVSVPTLYDCIFEDNQANSLGAAIFNDGSTSTGNTDLWAENCLFQNNESMQDAGAVFNDARSGGHSSPTFKKCQFLNNYAELAAGAVYNYGNNGTSSPIFHSCIFAYNETRTDMIAYAGAVYNLATSSGTSKSRFYNCLFNQNTAYAAGAIYNLGFGGDCQPLIANCTFYANTATLNGGAVYANAGNNQGAGISSPVIVNCIFWDNLAQPFTGDIFRNNYGDITISHSIVDVNNCGELTSGPGNPVVCGAGMIYNSNPLFADVANDDFRLQGASPAINVGENMVVDTNGISLDLDCSARVIPTIVDLGPYEAPDMILPVELLEFEAHFVQDRVHIFWSTANEQDNAFFQLERSQDGIHFNTLARIDGAGDSRNMIRYSQYDEHPFSGDNYYRLVQTDLDGRSSTSPIRHVEAPFGKVSAYPNPVTDVLYISISDFNAGPIDYEVYNLQGQPLFKGLSILEEGANMIQLDQVSELPAGTYLLRVFNGTERQLSHLFVKAND